MFKFLRNIIVALCAVTIGCKPKPQRLVPKDASQVHGDSIVNSVLTELFEGHSVGVVPDGDWLLVGDRFRVAGCVAREYPSPAGAHNLQIDIYIELADKRLMIESFGGVGASKQEAIKDGLANFAANSFHVMLVALFTNDPDDQVEVETWTINGKERKVIIGGMGVRTFSDKPFEPPTSWFATVKASIEKASVGSGTHWFRCYYAQYNKEPCAVEALLDNDDWPAVISTMNSIDWPARDDFYSVRVFAIIQDSGG